MPAASPTDDDDFDPHSLADEPAFDAENDCLDDLELETEPPDA
jgi:hypothetical protein